MVSCCFNFWWHIMVTICSYAYLPSLYFLWWGICWCHLTIFKLGYFLIVEFESFCIYWVSSLSDTSFANIYSHSMACHLTLLTLSFAKLQFLILINSSSSITSFMKCVFGLKSHHETSSHLSFSCILLEFFSFAFRI